jgi:hypothetical protein
LGTRWSPGVPHLAIQCHGTAQVSGRFTAWLTGLFRLAAGLL